MMFVFYLMRENLDKCKSNLQGTWKIWGLEAQVTLEDLVVLHQDRPEKESSGMFVNTLFSYDVSHTRICWVTHFIMFRCNWPFNTFCPLGPASPCSPGKPGTPVGP